MFSIAGLLIIFAAVIGSTVMMGVVAYLLHRIRQVEANTNGNLGSHQRIDQIDGLREELLTVQHELSGLVERMDFTEKLLMSGDDAESPGDPE